MKLYGLYTPKGRLVFVGFSAPDAWFEAFTLQESAFRAKYWGRERTFRASLRKLGWRVVPGTFTASPHAGTAASSP